MDRDRSREDTDRVDRGRVDRDRGRVDRNRMDSDRGRVDRNRVDSDRGRVERAGRITQTAARLGVSPVFVGLPPVSLRRQSTGRGCE